MSKNWNFTAKELPRLYARVMTPSMVVDVRTPKGWATGKAPDRWYYLTDPIRTENQQSISLWGRETFGKAKEPAVLVGRALEEVAELLQLLLPAKIGTQFAEVVQSLSTELKTPDRLPARELSDELADVLVVLYQAAEAYGIDLLGAVDWKMEVNRERKWKISKAGTGQHA